MLILTRRLGENIRIGDDVLVTFLGVRGGQVRLGVDAPKHIPVHREEIYKLIKLSQQPEQNEAPFTSVPNGVEVERFKIALSFKH